MTTIFVVIEEYYNEEETEWVIDDLWYTLDRSIVDEFVATRRTLKSGYKRRWREYGVNEMSNG